MKRLVGQTPCGSAGCPITPDPGVASGRELYDVILKEPERLKDPILDSSSGQDGSGGDLPARPVEAGVLHPDRRHSTTGLPASTRRW